MAKEKKPETNEEDVVTPEETNESGDTVSTEKFNEVMEIAKSIASTAEAYKAEIDILKERISILETDETGSESTSGLEKKKKDDRRVMSVRVYRDKDDVDQVVIGFVNKSKLKNQERYTYQGVDPIDPKKRINLVDLILETGEIVEGVDHVQYLLNAERIVGRMVSETVKPIRYSQGVTGRVEYADDFKIKATDEEVDLVVTAEKRVLTIELDNGKTITIDEAYVN